MGFDDFCNTSLVLELGLNNYNNAIKRSSPSLTLSLSGAGAGDESGASSFSSGRIIKREREESTAERLTIITSSRLMNGQDQEQEQEQEEEISVSVGVGRKKLRLNKEQSSLLEESFKNHSTLNPKQKQALARQLNLMPRQVEVWFQNRRARTKLKQTEVDYEFLKKCCETLTDENRRLEKEIQELKTLKLTHQSFLMQIPSSTSLTICPSCENIRGHGGPGNIGNGPTVAAAAAVVGDGRSFSITTTKAQFFNPFTNPSKAC